MIETIQHADGRVELNEDALKDIETSPLYNEDLAPVPVEKRNWTTYNYAALQKMLHIPNPASQIFLRQC